MQRTLVAPGSGSLAARVGSYLQAITEQNSLACAAYSVDGTSLYYALPTAVPLSEVEVLLAQDGEPRMVLANNHTLLCAGTVVLPERCITLVIAQDAAPVWQARQARTRNALIAELLAMVLAGEGHQGFGQADNAHAEGAVLEDFTHRLVHIQLFAVDPHALAHQEGVIIYFLAALNLKAV